MAALEQGPPDAIVLDVHLADRDDGWALAELVDLLGPKRPRIVFSTGSPEDIPPEIAELGAGVREALRSGAAGRSAGERGQAGLFARLRGAISLSSPASARSARSLPSSFAGCERRKKKASAQLSGGLSGSYHQPLGREGGSRR